MKKVLTIAGSDSGGGAGIQADLKTFAARGVYGMSAITALTAQNTIGVQGVFEIDANFVGKQIDSIMSDIGADVWKIGMLSNSSIIRIVANRIKKYDMKYVILDPVMVSKSGDPLIKKEARDTLMRELIHLSYVITPNHHEAQVLTRMEIKSLGDAQSAAIEINKLGAKNVIVKGGRIPNVKEAIDILYDGKKIYKFIAPRINTSNTHGTGCIFASAIAAEIAKGINIYDATHIAKAYLTINLRTSKDLNIGHGHGPIDHFKGYIIEVDPNTVKVE